MRNFVFLENLSAACALPCPGVFARKLKRALAVDIFRFGGFFFFFMFCFACRFGNALFALFRTLAVKFRVIGSHSLGVHFRFYHVVGLAFLFLMNRRDIFRKGVFVLCTHRVVKGRNIFVRALLRLGSFLYCRLGSGLGSGFGSGFDRFLNERDAQRLERLITGRTKDWRLRKYVTDHVAASVIVTLHSLRHDFKWGAKRLQDLQQYIHDNIDAVLKSQVPIWEFMKCLHVECGIDYPALTAYEKQFGPVDIYHGNRGER